MKIKVEMLEGDIVRSMKSNQFSPIQLSVSRHLRDNPENIEVNYDSVIVWDDSINDYTSYKYCTEDIDTIKSFMDEWNDYVDGNLVDFCLSPISFCIEEKKFKHTA
jgi:hypothetical protein